MNTTNTQCDKTNFELIDSGVSWIGKIPEHWRMIPNKYLFIETTRKVGSKWDSYQLLSLTTEGVKEKDIEQTGGKIPESYNKYLIIKEGQMIFCLFDLDVSAVFSGLSPYNGMITSAYNAYNVNESIADKRYIKYFFDFVFTNRSYKYYSKNLRYSVSADQFKNIKTLVPPLSEQIKIADYLDHQCGLTDNIILGLTNKIDALDQYKKSLIKEKVTTGFNNDDLIDSGIPWIGKIPKHWKVIPNKYCFQLQRDIVGARVDQYERLALTMNGVIKRSKEDNEGLQPTDFAGYQILRENQLVFKLIDLSNISTSRVGLSPYVGIVSPAYIVLQCNDNINERYAKHFFFMMYYGQIFNSLADNGVRANLGSRDLLNLPITVPPLPEQIEIADYLDKKCELIDEIKNDIEKEIEILKEYKKSLIFEYVTGKKVVSNEQDSI